jgi:hypothetical protein
LPTTSGTLVSTTTPINASVITSGTLLVSYGGTGVTTLTGLAYGNGTSAFTAASAANVVAVIGSTAVANATYATTAGSATTATNVAGSGITGSQGIPKAALPTGAILQVLQTVKTNTFTTSSTSYTDITGVAVTITPTSATSKILIDINLNVGISADTYHAYFRLNRNGSLVSGTTGTSGQPNPCMLHKNGNNTRDMDCAVMSFLDSPGSASALTYQVQVAMQSPHSVLINYCQLNDSFTPGGISTITVYEVAA